MNASIPIQSILNMLTNLSDSNKRWLADKLYEQVKSAEMCQLDKALHEAHTGKLYHADTVEELMKGLND